MVPENESTYEYKNLNILNPTKKRREIKVNKSYAITQKINDS